MLIGTRVKLNVTYPNLGVVTGDEGHIISTDTIGGVLVSFIKPNTRNLWMRPHEYEIVREEYTKEPLESVPAPTKADGGGGQNHYDLPKGATQLQDLIEHRNMNGSVKDIFKACYRLGEKEGVSDEYDLRKMVFYSLRELGRRLGRKDYITLAKEVIAHQAIEPGDTGLEEEHY